MTNREEKFSEIMKNALLFTAAQKDGKLKRYPGGFWAGIQEPYNTNIYKWFRELSERLRYVRVVCGDWTRVCGGNWQTNMGICGMFFDPPYGIENRDTKIYHHDSTTTAKNVESWVLERGNNKNYRIVVAGYKEEYQLLVENKWTTVNWKAQGGYSNLGKKINNKNNERETLFLSPHCCRQDDIEQMRLL